jgi:multiple RNA-binding domain-containing protein 1
MNTKLYVKNIPYEVSSQELSQWVSSVALPKKILLVCDKKTGWSKGFAFLEMKTQKDALKVLNELNEKPLRNRIIYIAKAKEKYKKLKDEEISE